MVQKVGGLIVKVLCPCGITFNNETVTSCPVCSQKLILSKHESAPIFKEYKKPIRVFTETYQATGIVAKTRRKYLKLYFKLERWREYKKNWARKKRQEQREKYGRILY